MSRCHSQGETVTTRDQALGFGGASCREAAILADSRLGIKNVTRIDPQNPTVATLPGSWSF